jgi:hypothetical protein
LQQDHVKSLKQLTKELWRDPDLKYTRRGLDSRYSPRKKHLLDQLAKKLQRLALASDASRVVIHRSMPFGAGQTTPYLEDLPKLAQRMGANWKAVVVMSIRDAPSAWASRSDPQRSLPYIGKIERMLELRDQAGGSGVDALEIVYLRYTQLHLCGKDVARRELAPLERLGIDVERLFESPELTPHVSEKHAAPGYIAKKARNVADWENKRHLYRRYHALTSVECPEQTGTAAPATS